MEIRSLLFMYFLLLWQHPILAYFPTEGREAKSCESYSSKDIVWSSLPAVISPQTSTSDWKLYFYIKHPAENEIISCVSFIHEGKQLKILATEGICTNSVKSSMTWSDNQDSIEFYISVKDILEIIRISNHESDIFAISLNTKFKDNVFLSLGSNVTTEKTANVTFNCHGGCQTYFNATKEYVSFEEDHHYTFYSFNKDVIFYFNIHMFCNNGSIENLGKLGYEIQSNKLNKLHINGIDTEGRMKVELNGEDIFNKHQKKNCSYIGADIELSHGALWTKNCEPQIYLTNENTSLDKLNIFMGVANGFVVFFVILSLWIFRKRLCRNTSKPEIILTNEMSTITSQTRTRTLNNHRNQETQRDHHSTQRTRNTLQEFRETSSLNGSSQVHLQHTQPNSRNSLESINSIYSLLGDHVNQVDLQPQAHCRRKEDTILTIRQGTLAHTDRTTTELLETRPNFRASHESINSIYASLDDYVTQGACIPSSESLKKDKGTEMQMCGQGSSNSDAISHNSVNSIYSSLSDYENKLI